MGVIVSHGVEANDAAGAEEMAGCSGAMLANSARRILAIAVQRTANNEANENNCLTNMMLH